jgi:hypothetical protein
MGRSVAVNAMQNLHGRNEKKALAQWKFRGDDTQKMTKEHTHA